MSRLGSIIVGAAVLAAGAGVAQERQVSGQVASGPPEDLFIEATVAPDALTLSATEFSIALGGYYRLNLVCPDGLQDDAGLRFEAPMLLQNAHLRIAGTAEPEVNFHLQGLTFRAIECEGGATARFSFFPMRPGTYDFVVSDSAEPPHEVTGQVVVE
jgi:hypothetical protein